MTTSGHPYTTADSRSGAVHLLHFRDPRAFHEVQFQLERTLMILFKPSVEDGTLRARAEGKVNGAQYRFELTLHAAHVFTNAYSLRAEGSWGDFAAQHDAYYRNASHSWFEFWTARFEPANEPSEAKVTTDRYERLTQAALHAESHLDSVAAIKRAIIEALKQGARYMSSHKEGGSSIGWRNGAFYRSDYGDDPRDDTFKDEASFFTMLEQFCHWDVRHPNGESLPDVDRWRLIWRRIDAM